LVAQDWITCYFTTYLRGCPFKAFIAEDGPNRAFPYPGDAGYPEHLLLSMKAAFKGGMAWSFHKERQVRLRIVNDASDSELDKELAKLLPSVLQSNWNTRRLGSKRPWLRVEPVEFVQSNPKEVSSVEWPDAEFVQLCDLLLGASFAALDVSDQPSGRAGRRKLAQAVTSVLADTLRVPWLQQAPVHRKFSVSLYPDRHNFAYPAALRMSKSKPLSPQQSMFDIS
jgi:hypothetical protein